MAHGLFETVDNCSGFRQMTVILGSVFGISHNRFAVMRWWTAILGMGF